MEYLSHELERKMHVEQTIILGALNLINYSVTNSYSDQISTRGPDFHENFVPPFQNLRDRSI